MDQATQDSKVSAFCRAALARVIPLDFWGTSEHQVHNKLMFFRNVDRFIRLRRFENLTLHEISQGMKVHKSTLID